MDTSSSNDFAKTLIISLVVGIVLVVVIGGLILWLALGWHRIFKVKPRDRTAEQWDVESAQRKSSSSIWRKTSGAWTSKSSFLSGGSKSAGAPIVNEKAKQWPSPTGSRTSSGDSVVVPPSPTRGGDGEPLMPKAVLR